MFYKSSRLSQFLTAAQRELVEQDVNDWIHEHGSVIYGNVDKDNKLFEFSSSKKPSDFWVGFAIALEVMGKAEPRNVPIQTKQVDDSTKVQALMDKNDQLERQLRQNNGKI